MTTKLFLPLWVLLSLLLLFYSFTQVDLSLTLSRASFLQDIQKQFQYIGWFNRPLSANLYIGLLLLMFLLYGWTIYMVLKRKLNFKHIFLTVICVGSIVLFSYNAFSYDLFNYIFDAKIVSFYHQNPYLFKPLDFPTDPMLSFMHSVHRVYPYGPVWLFLTVPLTFLSFNKFIIAFFIFKLFTSILYIASCYFMFKCARLINDKSSLMSLCLFAFNPLVIIEVLVSAHNEVAMVFLTIISFYLLLQKKFVSSWIWYILSVGIKYTTLFLLPIYIYKTVRKNLSHEQVIVWATILAILSVIATSVATGQNKNPEFQPWYLLTVAPFAALIRNWFVRLIFIAVSCATLFSYFPLIASGSWPTDIVFQKNMLIVIGFVMGVIIFAVYKLKNKQWKKS